jgi:hypothetical protein
MRRWLARVALAVLAIIVGAVVAAAIYLPHASERIRERLIADLSRDLESEVDVESLQMSLRPSPRVTLQGLVMRHKRRRDVPPLIQIRSLTAELSMGGWMAHRLDRVSIEGLRIFIPPRNREGAKPADTEREGGRKQAQGTTAAARAWFIDRLMSTDATLFLAVREPGIPPREFHIHRLAMSAVGPDRVMAFQAALDNPRPAGEIDTAGTFGPWQKDEPSLTPLQATYTFSHADLATFKGIGGILTSEGSFGGILERIEATGSTTTPDFRLAISGNPVPLTTRFEAVIDGTNGNTVLTHIDATLGRSRFVVSGAVIGKPHIDGRTITIDATIPKGRLDDVLRLAVKGKTPPLTGDIEVKTRILLPPGDRDVIDKLQLDGTFRVKAGRFTNLNVQSQLADLSRRGRGKPQEASGPSPVSNMAGRFTLKDTVMTLPELTFGVPGATIVLRGRYHLRQETVDFLGTVRLQAKASQTITGVKRFLLKPLDPLFARDGAGTVLPIHIAGTRDHPAFKVDVKSALLRRDPS